MKKGNVKKIAGIIGLVGLVGCGATADTTVGDTTSTTAATSTALSDTTTKDVATTTSDAAEGSYTATAPFTTDHNLQHEITVTLDVAADGTITDADVDIDDDNDHHSVRYTARFLQNYESYVIGENIDDLDVSVIAGASDTTKGFNDAVEEIRAQI